MTVRTGLMALALGLPLMVAGCDDSGTDAQFGEVTLQLTDAVGEEVTEAWVTFTDVYLQGENGDQDPPGGRVYLLEAVSESFELTSLADDIAALVEEEEVPTGTYGQLRVVLSGGCIETDDGSVYASDDSYTRCGTPTGELRMPSMQQSGVKVLLDGLQVTGGQHVLLLDFDVEDSFGHAAGQSGAWVMTPVIHTSDITLTGGVEVTLDTGEVSLPDGVGLADFSVTMLPADGDSSRVAFEADADDEDAPWAAAFRFLIPELGPFDFRLNAPEGWIVTVDPASPTRVELDSGASATVDWVIQSIEEEPAEG